MKRHQYHLMAGECQQQTYLEKIYQTVLNPRTVLVEPTDRDDDDRNVHLKKLLCLKEQVNISLLLKYL